MTPKHAGNFSKSKVEQHETGEPIIISRSIEITSLLMFTHMDPHF